MSWLCAAGCWVTARPMTTVKVDARAPETRVLRWRWFSRTCTGVPLHGEDIYTIDPKLASPLNVSTVVVVAIMSYVSNTELFHEVSYVRSLQCEFLNIKCAVTSQTPTRREAEVSAFQNFLSGSCSSSPPGFYSWLSVLVGKNKHSSRFWCLGQLNRACWS